MELEDVLRYEQPERLLLAIEGQSNVFRYCQFPVVRRQTVAEHVARASQIMLLVLADLRIVGAFNKLIPAQAMTLQHQMLSAILLHDIGESVVGNIPYPVKVAVPQVRSWEESVASKIVEGSGYDSVIPLSDTLWAVIIKAVDMAELVMYCTTELGMGNELVRPVYENGFSALMGMANEISLALETNELLPTLKAILDRADSMAK